MNLLRAFDPKLYDMLHAGGYSVTDEALMPEEYRYPNGRYKHDDWAIGKNILRKDCAYRVPLPFKVISGPYTREWMAFAEDYPLSPGMETKRMDVQTPDGVAKNVLHVLTDRGQHGLVKYAAFISGEWRHVFTKYTGLWFGKRLSWYWGLHQDNCVSFRKDMTMRSDLMTWMPELACSWVSEAP